MTLWVLLEEPLLLHPWQQGGAQLLYLITIRIQSDSRYFYSKNLRFHTEAAAAMDPKSAATPFSKQGGSQKPSETETINHILQAWFQKAVGDPVGDGNGGCRPVLVFIPPHNEQTMSVNFIPLSVWFVVPLRFLTAQCDIQHNQHWPLSSFASRLFHLLTCCLAFCPFFVTKSLFF